MADLFDLFGIEAAPVEPKETKKAAKAEKSTKTAKTAKAKAEKTYELPLTIYTGHREPLEVVAEGKKSLTVTELKKFLASNYCEYQPGITAMEFKPGKVFAAFKDETLLSKGDVKLTSGSKITFGGVDLDISELLPEEGEVKVSLKSVTQLLSGVNPVFANIGLYSTGAKQMGAGFLYPLLADKVLEFPIRLVLFGRASWEITKEAYTAFLKDAGNDVSEVTFSKDVLEQMVIKEFPELEGRCSLRYDSDTNIVLVGMNVKEEKVSSTPKEELFPTNATLSFVFKKVDLSPDMFGGKEKVTKKEILKFAGTIFPEYDNDKTQLRYDKERNMLIPVLVGSTKGAIDCTNSEDLYAEWSEMADGTVFMFDKEGTRYRCETTPISLTVASCEGTGWYEYRLPKMPGNLLKAIYGFFKQVESQYKTEVLVRIFYDPLHERYVLHVPQQKVTASAVSSEEVVENSDWWLVMDIHSHCHYPAFFSATDDMDEIATRLYGVIGNLQDRPEFLLRACTGAKRIMVESEQVFDVTADDGKDYYQMLMNQWNNIEPCR